jgi:hypothetical protein
LRENRSAECLLDFRLREFKGPVLADPTLAVANFMRQGTCRCSSTRSLFPDHHLFNQIFTCGEAGSTIANFANNPGGPP